MENIPDPPPTESELLPPKAFPEGAGMAAPELTGPDRGETGRLPNQRWGEKIRAIDTKILPKPLPGAADVAPERNCKTLPLD
jgi:hypothetical protein